MVTAYFVFDGDNYETVCPTLTEAKSTIREYNIINEKYEDTEHCYHIEVGTLTEEQAMFEWGDNWREDYKEA